MSDNQKTGFLALQLIIYKISNKGYKISDIVLYHISYLILQFRYLMLYIRYHKCEYMISHILYINAIKDILIAKFNKVSN